MGIDMPIRRWRTGATLIAILMSGLVLSGCIAFQPMPARDIAATAEVGRWVAIAPDRARVRLSADAPAILAGRERRHADSRLVQELTLANATVAPGSNLLAVALEPRGGGLFASGLSGGAISPLPYALRAEDIARVAQDRLTGAEIAGPPATRSNRYGPFTYVTATSPAGVRCILAWQAVGPEAAARLPAPASQAAVQLRYCAAGHSTDELLRVFESLTLPS